MAHTGDAEGSFNAEKRDKEEHAEQLNLLRRSSVIHHQRPHSSSGPRSDTSAAAATTDVLRLPLWNDANGTFLAPLTRTQLDSLIARPAFSPDQKALAAEWENIYTPSCPWVPFTPFLPLHDDATRPAGAVPIKVSQGIGANCSVVAGLNALVAHNARQKGTTALGVRNFVDVRLKQQKGDEAKGEEATRYWRVKVFVNGAWRSVSGSYGLRQRLLFLTVSVPDRYRLLPSCIQNDRRPTTLHRHHRPPRVAPHSTRLSVLAPAPGKDIHRPPRLLLRISRIHTKHRPLPPDRVDPRPSPAHQGCVPARTHMATCGKRMARRDTFDHARNRKI